MWKWINETITQFKPCFSRRTAFGWFVIVIIGLMIRTDDLGISSIVRALSLSAESYMSMLHFFRANSWNIETIKTIWLLFVKRFGLLIKEVGRYIMIGDGVKQAKEGRKMPGITKLHQESENSAKGEYIYGHLFGGLGILAGNAEKQYSIPLSARMHSGVKAIEKWRHDEEYNGDSHVVRMMRDAISAAERLGECILLLDRQYLSKPMLETLRGQTNLQVVTKAKTNAIAYYDPKPKTGRGARPKKGESVKVRDLFDEKSDLFTTVNLNLYRKDKQVRFFSADLLWGIKLYQKLRFVLTEMDGVRSILVSTDLTLSPEQIIRLYSYRFKIECSFRELKQVVSAFSYHFWSKAMPKLNKYKSNDDNQSVIEGISNPKSRELIKSALRAIEGYVQFSCIALGLLQMISLLFGKTISGSKYRFMRTKSNAVPSEGTIADFLRKNIFSLFRFFPDLPITAIISAHQPPLSEDFFDPSA